MDWDNAERALKDIYFIKEECFHKKFGNMTKLEFETMLFSLYIERLLDNNEKIDDYTIGKTLGLSEARVRTLKERKQLYYPREGFKWENVFLENARCAQYDDRKNLVKFNIPDVNVMKELRHFMEDNGWYDEYQLNAKLFQCHPEVYMKLLCKITENENKEFTKTLGKEEKKKLETIKKSASPKEQNAITQIINGEVEDGIKFVAKVASKTILKGVLSTIPFAGFLQPVIDALLEAMKS